MQWTSIYMQLFIEFAGEMLFFTTTIFLFGVSESAKILFVAPVASYSHFVVYRQYVKALASRGHEIVSITTDELEEKHENVTEIVIHDLSYQFWRENFVNTYKGPAQNVKTIFEQIVTISTNLFELQMKDDKVQKILQEDSNKYDLVVFEAPHRQCLAFSHKFRAPIIGISSLQAFTEQNLYMGAPTHSILYPTMGATQLSNHNILDKIRETFIDLYSRYIFKTKVQNLENKVFKEVFGNDCPNLEELNKNVDMLFINMFSVYDNNRPNPQTIVNMGALQLEPPKELPQDLKEYLENSPNGAIYMSLGTNVQPSQFHSNFRQVILNVFGKLPYNVLIKWDEADFEVPTNLKTMKHFPQMDLLKHPNIKLFITQGGLQSADEAIAARVPLIAIPVFGDQFINGDKFEKFGIGKKLDFKTLNEDVLEKAIIEVIGNESYRLNIAKLDAIYRDQAQTPIARAIWWTEYVLRHRGAKHLRSPAADLSSMEYYLLDVAIYLLGVIILAVIAAFILVKKLTSYLKTLKSRRQILVGS